MDSIKFSGSIPALPTPFEDGRLDLGAFQRQVHRLATAGCGGIVVAGSTGEGALLDPGEFEALVTCARGTANGALPVIASVGTPGTHNALQLARLAANSGANALLVTTPYYVRASDEGIFRHYHMIADAADLPVLLYNVPGRTAVNVSVELIARLFAAGVIVGMKEAGCNLPRLPDLRARTGESFALLAGDDYAAFAMRCLGGHGCISVVANVLPAVCARAHRLCDEHAYAPAKELFSDLAPLQESLFLESNPQGLKYAMHRLGFCRNELRLPLLPVSQATAARIDGTLQQLSDKCYLT